MGRYPQVVCQVQDTVYSLLQECTVVTHSTEVREVSMNSGELKNCVLSKTQVHTQSCGHTGVMTVWQRYSTPTLLKRNTI